MSSENTTKKINKVFKIEEIKKINLIKNLEDKKKAIKKLAEEYPHDCAKHFKSLKTEDAGFNYKIFKIIFNKAPEACTEFSKEVTL